MREAAASLTSSPPFSGADEAAVRAFHAADPYKIAGLFERVDLRPWRATIFPS
jgi:uncharacterized protein YciI